VKLAVRYALAAVLGAGGTAAWFWWGTAGPLARSRARAQALQAQLEAQRDALREREARLSVLSAGRDAGVLAAAAADQLGRFVAEANRVLGGGTLRAAARDAAAAAQAVLHGSAIPLDRAVVTDAAGRVTAVAPPNTDLAGASFLSPADVRDFDRREPRFVLRDAGPGQSKLLAAGIAFRAPRAGPPAGVLLAVASFEQIVQPVFAKLPAGAEGRLLVVSKAGEIVHAPLGELVGRPLMELPEFRGLADGEAGRPVEVGFNLARWMGVRRSAPLGMSVIALAAIGPAAPPPGGGPPADASESAAPPWPILGGGALLLLAASLGLALAPLGRLKGLAAAANALASGAGAVDLKGASAKDEIGAAARALEKVAEQLAAERRHREETTQAYTAVQRELERVQTELKEAQEYQRNLEVKARREQEAREGELAQARQELDGARNELEGLRAQLREQQQALAARAEAIQQRDEAIRQRDATLTQAAEQIRQLQDSMGTLSRQLAETQAELERRKAAPAAAFRLFAEASEALAGEMSGLVELVQGYVSQIVSAAGGAISDEQQQFLQSVIARSARSQRLMGDLKDFANVVRPDGLAREPVDLLALLTDVVAAVQPSADDKGVTIETDLPAELPEAIGDEARLRQLFTILLQNAVRFVPDGGHIRVSVGLREQLVGIRIEDNAESLPASSDEVFDRFHRADEEILELRGSGLRFPMLRAIASAHGGSIDLAITEQGGNLFFVRLPVRAGAPDAAQTAALFAAVPEPESPPAAELSAAPDVPAAEAGPFATPPAEIAAPEAPAFAFDPGAPGPPVETTESILAANPDQPAAGLQDLWTVPGAEAPPTLDALEAAALGPEPEAPAPAPAAEEPPAPAAGAPPPAFSFGSDEIIQE
jgi:signal transduction histidine kinase